MSKKDFRSIKSDVLEGHECCGGWEEVEVLFKRGAGRLRERGQAKGGLSPKGTSTPAHSHSFPSMHCMLEAGVGL